MCWCPSRAKPLPSCMHCVVSFSPCFYVSCAACRWCKNFDDGYLSCIADFELLGWTNSVELAFHMHRSSKCEHRQRTDYASYVLARQASRKCVILIWDGQACLSGPLQWNEASLPRTVEIFCQPFFELGRQCTSSTLAQVSWCALHLAGVSNDSAIRCVKKLHSWPCQFRCHRGIHQENQKCEQIPLGYPNRRPSR